jgi:RHS repeat-associated protein
MLLLDGAIAERCVTRLVLAQEDASGNVQWFLTDHEGSVRDVLGLVSGNWQVVSHITYTSFGVATAPNGMPRFGFAGRELDGETGLYYNRMRYYDANTGRFLSEDLSGFRGG